MRPLAEGPEYTLVVKVDDAGACQADARPADHARRRAWRRRARASADRAACSRRSSTVGEDRRLLRRLRRQGRGHERRRRDHAASWTGPAPRRLARRGRTREAAACPTRPPGSSTRTCQQLAAAARDARESGRAASRSRPRRRQPRRAARTAIFYGSVDGDVLSRQGIRRPSGSLRARGRPLVPLHLGVRHRGPSRQDGRPDLGLDPRRRPRGRPAGPRRLRDAVTTGLVVVAGEITTETYVDIPRLVRQKSARSATTARSTASTPRPAA